MESAIEVSQTDGTSKPKPVLAPKPRLTPKPFSLQKNTTIRSIYAPKTATATSKITTQQTGKSEAAAVPKPTLAAPAPQPTASDSKPSSVRALTKDQPKPTKESKASSHGEDSLDSSVGKSDPPSQTAPPKETPKSEPSQRDDVIQTNHKPSTDIVTNSEQKDGKKKEDETQTSLSQKLEESGGEVSSTAKPTYRRDSTRKRLSMELTSKFESGGLSLPPQPNISISTTDTKDDANKPESPEPERSQKTPEPSKRESNKGGLTEDYGGGGSIKRRISLLFDSSSKPEVMTKKEEPEIINGTTGVKDRIKHWVTETNTEDPKPQVVPRTHSKSFEPATAPTAEKTPKVPPVEPPATGASSSQTADLPSKVSPAEQPPETQMETSKDALTVDLSSGSSRETSGEQIQNKSTEGDVQLRNRSSSTSLSATDEGDSAASESAQHAPKRDNVKRRSVRFGIVERDDGGPPVILGSGSDSSTEEEQEDASENEAEEDIPVSVPVYRRVGALQKKDDAVNRQEEERLKHLEFEKRRRAEEMEQARLKLEEEQKKKEEEEREKEKAKQREDEERERERLKEEEMERQRKEEFERERMKKEEQERERLREEEMERERQMELMLQRQREEERERAKQKEERLKKDQEEREKERLKEEERKEERLREERERQKLRKEEEISIDEHKEHRLEVKQREEEMNKEKQREEEWEKAWVNRTERLGGAEEEREREKELELMWQRKKEEDRESARQKEETLREERERQRLRKEEEISINKHEDHRLEVKRREEEMNKEKQREEEWEKAWVNRTEKLGGREKEKELELMWQRNKEEDRERARQKEERLRQEEMEKERLREEAEGRERERQRRLKEQQEKDEEMERMRQIQMEKQREEERREEERKRQIEKERVEELERKMREELDRKRAEELEEKLRMEEERKRDELTNRERESAVDEAETDLISFDVPQKSESPYSFSAKTDESLNEVVYDDFSVRPSLMKVEFDDFSVKPRRWGSQAKVETSPVIRSWQDVPVDEEEVEVLVPLDVRPQENKVPEQVEKPDSPEPTLAQERPEEEEQPISMEVEEEDKETEEEEEGEEEEETQEEEDKQEAQVNSYCTNGEDRDTDALIDNEPDQQNEACEQTSESDSPKPVPDQVPEVSSEDIDTTDFHSVAELAPFPESSTPLLDTSAQRSKGDLGKRRIRTRPSRSLRGGLAPKQAKSSPDWRTCDSTDERDASSKQRESDSEEEQPKPKIVCSPPPASQRVPMFPGLSPSALIAQLKRRTGGGGPAGGVETEEDKGREEKESQNVEVAPSASLPSRSPRSPAHLAGAARVLPPLGGADGGAVSSPAWLKELKSKKRLSQYDSEA